MKYRKNYLQRRSTLENENDMLSSWLHDITMYKQEIFMNDRYDHKEAIMSFLKKMQKKGRSKNHQELHLRASVPSPTVECAKDKW